MRKGLIKESRPKIDFNTINNKKIDWGEISSWDITKISEDDLKDMILFSWQRSAGNYKHDAVASILVSETNRRVLERARISNEKSGRISLWIAIGALFLSFASVLVALIDFFSK